MSLGARIARIKAVPFVDAMRLVAIDAGIEFPDPPRVVRCPLPGHSDRKPSFSFREDGWKCFGENLGGDVLDFIQALEGIESFVDAVVRAEALLGLGDPDEALIGLARKKTSPVVEDARRTRSRWAEEVEEVAVEVRALVRPYARSPDGLVSGIAGGRVDWIEDELDEARSGPIPATERGRRERVRSLRLRALATYAGLVRDVESSTGKTAAVVATLAPPVVGGPRGRDLRLARKGFELLGSKRPVSERLLVRLVIELLLVIDRRARAA